MSEASAVYGNPHPWGLSLTVVDLRGAIYSLYERRLRAHLEGLPVPQHVAIMIDGNRRWARAAGFDDVSQGHVVGARHIADLLGWCTEVGVAHVTVWLLSTDNLRRPPNELEPLLRIIAGVADELSAPGRPWRMNVVGALDLLPAETAEALKRAEERTAERDGLTGIQRLFLNWAYVWRTKRRKELALQYLTTDPHSPPEFRANIAGNLTEFHEAFGTKPGDGMWLEPDQRVRIW